MPPDTVQIGRFVFSRILLDMTIPLLSVIVGGLITYFTTRALGHAQWKKEQRAELIKRKREALERALVWADIVDRGVNRATLLAGNFASGMIDEDHFRQRWPDLLGKLAETDVPPHLNVLLPREAIVLGLKVVRQLDELYALSLHARGSKSREEWEQLYSKTITLSVDLQKQVASFRAFLTQEYVRTFQG